MQLLPPIDATGEATVWASQDLQAFDGLRRVWVRHLFPSSIGPTVTPFRMKVSDISRWNAHAAWPDHMQRGGFRARLLVWEGSRWIPKQIVESWYRYG